MRPSAAVTTAIVALAGLLAVAIAALGSRPPIDAVFLLVILSCLGLVLRQGAHSWWQAARADRRVRELRGVEPTSIARSAVREERRRLNDDISRALRESLLIISAEALEAGEADDPRPALTQIRLQAQLATSELRRQLGLLRDDQPAPPAPVQPTPRALTIGRSDIALTAAVVALAVIESLLYPWMDGEPVVGASALLTALVASTVLIRRVLPEVAALVAACLYLVALPLQAPVANGFWSLIAVAALIWRICAGASGPGAGRSSRAAYVAAGALGAASAVSTWVLDPDNAGLWLVVLGVSVTGGLLVRSARRRAAAAERAASQRRHEIELATELAVGSERQAYARDLHDVVSHAIGLIVVQAGAGQVAWTAEPETTRGAIQIIADTAAAALAELDRAAPVDNTMAPTRRHADLVDLVERIRLSGTPVRLETDIDPSQPLDSTAYRVAQEALTNVVRHAPGASARVRLTTRPDGRLQIEVTDDGPATASTERGYGLIGLDERVRLAGGVLEARPDPDGRGFRVLALLPGVVTAPA